MLHRDGSFRLAYEDVFKAPFHEGEMKIKSLKDNEIQLDKLLCILYKNLCNSDRSLFKLYFKYKVQSYTASKVIWCDVEDHLSYYYTFNLLNCQTFLSFLNMGLRL